MECDVLVHSMRKCCSCVSIVEEHPLVGQLYGHDHPDSMSIAVRTVAVIKALAVAEAKLCDWKLAVLLWAIALSASSLYACWTRCVLLWCWLLGCLYCFCSCALLLLLIIWLKLCWEFLMFLEVCPACPRLV